MTDTALSVIHIRARDRYFRYDGAEIEAERNDSRVSLRFGVNDYDMSSEAAREIGHQLMQYADWADGKVVEFTTTR